MSSYSAQRETHHCISGIVKGFTDFEAVLTYLLTSDAMFAVATASLLTLVQQLSGTPYISGGNSAAGTDCSGLVSFVTNAATGRPVYGDRFNTGNIESALKARGFQYGSKPRALNVGWNRGHTAATLPDGTPVSSGEGGGGGRRRSLQVCPSSWRLHPPEEPAPGVLPPPRSFRRMVSSSRLASKHRLRRLAPSCRRLRRLAPSCRRLRRLAPSCRRLRQSSHKRLPLGGDCGRALRRIHRGWPRPRVTPRRAITPACPMGQYIRVALPRPSRPEKPSERGRGSVIRATASCRIVTAPKWRTACDDAA